MEFGLSEQDRMLQDSVTRFLDDACPLDRVRKAAEGGETHAGDVWQGLSELGVPGLIIPEEHGGMGLGFFAAGLVAEAIGAHVAPVPFLSSTLIAPAAICWGGSDAQKSRWLPQLADGSLIAGVALSEATGAREGAGVDASAGKLTGKALFALDAMAADLIVVADRQGGLHLVEGGAPGLARRALTSIDATRSLAELTFDKTPAEPLGNAGADLVGRLLTVGRTMLAADMLGAGSTMIDKAVAYAKERKQFNRVIGSFQAVKHMCAEMAAELEPCRSLVWYSAHALDAIPAEAPLMACHAKAHLSEVGRFVARTATEVHGGMGFTDLLGLHYWFKRIGVDRQLLGSPERLRQEAAVLQGLAA